MLGQLDQSLTVHEAALQVDLALGNRSYLCVDLSEIARVLAELNCLARSDRCVVLELKLAERTEGGTELFRARFDQFRQFAETGRWTEAKTVWQALEQYGALERVADCSPFGPARGGSTREPDSGKGV